MTETIPVNALSAAQAREELARLAREIAQANADYHGKDSPQISDAAFDALKLRNAEIEARFPALKRADSPTDQVGAPVAESTILICHGWVQPRERSPA